MKALKSILTGAILTAALGNADADVVVRISGSTAYRTQTHLAIARLLGGSPVAAYKTGASLSASGTTWFRGTIASQAALGTVTIKCAWSGAVEGTATAARSANASFLPDEVSASAATGSTGSSVTGGTSITDATVAQSAQVAMTDQFQSSTPFTNQANSVNATLVEIPVGIIAFEWVLSECSSASTTGNTTSGSTSVTNLASTAGITVGQLVSGAAFPAGTVVAAVDSAAGTLTTSAAATATATASTLNFGAAFTNVTPFMMQALFKNGAQAKSLFTNNPADEGFLVYPTGRDPFSGTRVIALAEAGIGANSAISQFQITASLGAVTAYAPYATTTTNANLGVTLGRGGETSGGTLAAQLGNRTNDTTGYAVTYMGTSDAVTAVANGAHRLTWNGVPYSLAAVKNGQYTFWAYENLCYRPDVAADVKTVADALASTIITDTAQIKLSEMRVQRSGDGTVVTPKF